MTSGKKKDSDGDYDGTGTPYGEDRGGKPSQNNNYEENQRSPIPDKDFDHSRTGWS